MHRSGNSVNLRPRKNGGQNEDENFYYIVFYDWVTPDEFVFINRQ